MRLIDWNDEMKFSIQNLSFFCFESKLQQPKKNKFVKYQQYYQLDGWFYKWRPNKLISIQSHTHKIYPVVLSRSFISKNKK